MLSEYREVRERLGNQVAPDEAAAIMLDLWSSVVKCWLDLPRREPKLKPRLLPKLPSVPD